jgi:hypothetical protein
MKELLRSAPTGDVGLTELAELVVPASDEELAAWMADPSVRKPLLDLIYEAAIEMLGTDPLDLDDEIIHWHVAGAPEGGFDSFQLVIDGGVALPSRCLTQMPHLSFEVGSVELLRLAAGQESFAELIGEGIEALGGEWRFATQLEALFAG